MKWNKLYHYPPSTRSTTDGIRTYAVGDDGSTSEATRLAIGTKGAVLKVDESSNVEWKTLWEASKIYYVDINGTDAVGFGFTKATPFKTIRYACAYITGDATARAPATIFVATGLYKEILPIVVPKDTAIVGDELRSTTVMPETGYETSDMFRMHNGTGLRNMTLQGLSGTLGTPNDNLTRRPSAGAYACLDPATGPSDSYAWITSKSPYVQNVTTFGTGCIGMKVDGTLHDGGNKSMVANDFTQILSDGIGYWCNADGLSELVSVFTYYCHIGYLCTDGGKVRALNGNNSYGLYGSVAEGYNVTETPITATVDNRSKEAQIYVTYTDQNQIFGFGYTHAGQDYTNAGALIASNGSGEQFTFNEFRQGGVSEIFASEEDSNFIGGANYQYLANKAQIGNTTQITLSGADTGTEAKYKGMRIYLYKGTGAGQYAQIDTLNTITKIATVVKESNGEPGWEHLTGMPIQATLDESTYYSIEPRVTVAEPTFASSTQNLNGTYRWSDITYGNNQYVAVAKGGTFAATSSDGTGWTNATLPSTSDWSAVTENNGKFITVAEGSANGAYSTDGSSWTGTTLPANLDWSGVAGKPSSDIIFAVARTGDSTGTAIAGKSTDGGQTWATNTLPSTADWAGVAYGQGKWVIISGGSNVALYSTDDGGTWTQTTLPSSQEWNKVIMGQDRFVAISEKTDSTACVTAVSFDGITWHAGSVETGQWRDLAYSQGLYVMLDPLSDIVATSQDGFCWKSKVVGSAGDWTGIAANDGIFLAVQDNSADAVRIAHGAQAKARAIVGSGRIGTFVISNPGSYYNTATPPIVTIFDPQSTLDVTTIVSVNNGVLTQPNFTNRGTGHFSIVSTINSGDGFADIRQISDTLIVEGLGEIPGPGDNINIGGIDGVTYYVVKILSQSGSLGSFKANFQISPGLGRQEAPVHGTAVTIRQRYSQIRLTGHDFLDIGSGNFTDTAYPSLYIFGFESTNEPQQFNEVVQYNGGRVFYTSTDQDGNFRVGELFEVEQSTGTISINASFFDLSGLEELALGGVVLGGTGAVIREFSTDGTFTANSNNIVPTQKAIATYVKSRISSGGSDVQVNRLNAGNISFTSDRIFKSTGGIITIHAPVRIQGDPTGTAPHGVMGNMLALSMFAGGSGS